jgi:spore coat polysaccharide biosynthesis predicted glycosyltransferase SpsG
MAECSGYITTAGFESLCEALYLGKPTLMVPVAGHYEQACNALDAVKAGVGISASGFEVDRLVQFLPFYQPKDQAFRQWADSAGHQLLALFENSQVPLLPPSASEWAASWRPAWE